MNDINFSVYKNTLKRTDGFSPVSGEGNYTRLIFHFRPGDDWDNCTAVTVSYYKGNRSATHSNTAVSDGTATFTVPDEVIRPDHKIYFCLQGSYTEGSVQRTIVTNVIALNVNRGYIVEEGAAQNVYESLLAAVNQIAAAKANAADVTAALALKANAADVYTKTEADSGFASKSGFDTFVTETYADDMTDLEDAIDLKANSSDVAAALALKANAADVYTKTEADAGFASKAGFNTFVTETYADDMTDLEDAIDLKANSSDVAAALALKANAAEVYTKTETDTALAKKENAAEVDYTITKITGCHREEIGKSGYITTDEPITSLEPTPHSKWRCEVISCEPGDVFTVYTKGDSHKLAWVFLDNSNAKLTPSAKPNTDVNDAVITAPEGAVKLIINANVNSVEPYCFRGELTLKSIEEIRSALTLKANSSDIPTKTSDLMNDSGFISQHQNISGKADSADVNTALTALGLRKINFTYGKYISTSTGSSAGTVTENSKYKSAILNCEEGECFVVTGVGGSAASLSLWAFFKKSGDTWTRLTCSGGRDSVSYNEVIKAPPGVNKLIINIRLYNNGPLVDSDCYRCGDDVLLVLSYYENHLLEKINEINALPEGDMFVFVTDYHIQSNSRNSPALIKRVLEETPAGFVVFGGDAQDYETSHSGAMRVNLDFKKDFSKLWDKMYNIVGNHEFNSHFSGTYGNDIKLTYDQIYSFFLKDREYWYGDRNSYGDYWIDNVPSKIRYFFLGCTETSTMANDQLKWFFSALGNVPDEYLVVVFTHLTFKYDSDVDQQGVEHGDPTQIFVQGNISPIARAMKRFNKGLAHSVTLGGESLTYDYSEKHGTAIAIIGGHTHYDASTEYSKLVSLQSNPRVITKNITWTDVPVISVTTDAIDKQQNNTGVLSRTVGTITEQAFDVVHIDRSERKIIMKRIGAGNDRVFVFPWSRPYTGNTYNTGDVVSFEGRKFQSSTDNNENPPMDNNGVIQTGWTEILYYIYNTDDEVRYLGRRFKSLTDNNSTLPLVNNSVTENWVEVTES